MELPDAHLVRRDLADTGDGDLLMDKETFEIVRTLDTKAAAALDPDVLGKMPDSALLAALHKLRAKDEAMPHGLRAQSTQWLIENGHVGLLK